MLAGRAEGLPRLYGDLVMSLTTAAISLQLLALIVVFSLEGRTRV